MIFISWEIRYSTEHGLDAALSRNDEVSPHETQKKHNFRHHHKSINSNTSKECDNDCNNSVEFDVYKRNNVIINRLLGYFKGDSICEIQVENWLCRLTAFIFIKKR